MRTRGVLYELRRHGRGTTSKARGFGEWPTSSGAYQKAGYNDAFAGIDIGYLRPCRFTMMKQNYQGNTERGWSDQLYTDEYTSRHLMAIL